MPAVSTDTIAVYEIGGISIPEFIKINHGNWVPFRDLEFSILQKLENARNIILDCGGGIIFDIDTNGKEVVSDRKISLLKKIGKIVRLDANSDFLVSKVKNDLNRPNLSDTEPYSEILKRRTIQYNMVADFAISTEGKDPDTIAKKIIEIYPALLEKN